MLRFTMTRAWQSVPTLFIVSGVVFILARLAPGDPVVLKLGSQALAPGNEQIVERMRSELGLDQPLVTQFLLWLRDLAHGDLGVSIHSGQSVGRSRSRARDGERRHLRCRRAAAGAHERVSNRAGRRAA